MRTNMNPFTFRGPGAASLMLAAIVAVIVAVIVAQGGVAAAAPELRFETKPSEPTPQNKKPPPTITVTVVGGTPMAPEAYVLRQVDGKLAGVKATKVMRYVEGGEPVGVAVLVFGDATWLSTRKELVGALESAMAGVAAAGPPGSQGIVLMYGSSVEVRKPAGPLAELTGVKLAPKDPPATPAPRDLAGGIKQAIAELDKLNTPRKALLIIGDGIDGEGSKSPSGPMRDFARQLEEKKIVAFAAALQFDDPALGSPVPPPVKIHPKTGDEITDPVLEDAFAAKMSEWRKVKDQAIADLKILVAGQVQKMTSVGNIESAVGGFTSLLDDRYYVTFPGFDPRLKAGFAWDGKEHPLMLRIDGQDQSPTPTPVTLTPTWSAGGGGGTGWWIWLLAAGGGALVIGGAVAATRKKQPAVAPGVGGVGPGGVPVGAGAVPGAPGAPGAPGGPAGVPPGPPKPQKTMFVGGGDDAVFPQVGWMVFMTGPKRLRYIKLRPGTNKIGTGPNCEVVIDDGFMSTEHTLVLMMPDGYWVQDNNSTNGTFVNDHKLSSKQELYDNDLIMVGKTVLKFKSV